MSKDYIVKIVEHDFVKQRWSEIELLIINAFSHSKFNGEYLLEELPIQWTWEAVNKPVRKGLKHVVAVNIEEKILGAFFCIPTYRYEHEISCDLGWLFTSYDLSYRERIRICDAIVERTHEELRNAGFKKVITDIGTEAGVKYLSKRHGYIHRPLEENANRWEKDL